MSSAEIYPETFERFTRLAREKTPDETMMALIIDSPWMPGYAGLNTLDFYFDPASWLAAYQQALDDLPGVAFVPGAWAEFGMATEPSGWGVSTHWSDIQPPHVRHYPGGLDAVIQADVPNPETDGLMPALLRQYERMGPELASRGLAPRMAAARGPLAVASHLVGVTDLLMATQMEPEKCHALFRHTTDLCIAWLRAQLERMTEPVGVLVLDDVIGMMGPADAKTFGLPLYREIFDAFPGLIHIFHNDTPNPAIYPGLATIGMDVFNFSHTTDAEEARRLVGPDIVLMGNIPPVEVLINGTPQDARQAAEEMLDKAQRIGPVLISPGGGVSPETPIANLQAVAEAVRARA